MLALNLVILVLVFVTWRPPKVEVWLRQPSVLNETWYGPALLILAPVLLYWVSKAVTVKPLRAAGYLLSITALLMAIYAVVHSREFPNRGLPFNPDARLERSLDRTGSGQALIAMMRPGRGPANRHGHRVNQSFDLAIRVLTAVACPETDSIVTGLRQKAQ